MCTSTKLTNVPIYEIHELPKPEEEYDESHPLCTRVMHQNMLFPLAWTETDIPEDKHDDRGLPDHQTCMPQGEAVEKTEFNENVGVQPLGHGCENVTLCPGLVEVAPILSEHYPQNLVLRGERARACITYLRRYL